MDDNTLDQAQELRNKMAGAKRGLRIITIASGKGGVGKSCLTVNLAIALAQLGVRVLIVDADFGLPNVDVLLGAPAKRHLGHFLRGERKLDEVVQIGYDGVRFISGGSGLTDLLKIGQPQVAKLMNALTRLDMAVDVILCDVGAGVTDNIVQMITASTETIVVATPEPTAILDAFALVKTVARRDDLHPFWIVMNRVDNRREAERVLEGFQSWLRTQLHKDAGCYGLLADDAEVPRSVKKQTPVMIAAPESRYAHDVRAAARALMGLPPVAEQIGLLAKLKAKLRDLTD